MQHRTNVRFLQTRETSCGQTVDESAVFHCDFATKCQTGAKRYGDPKRFAWKVREGKLSTAGVDKEGVMLKRFELEAETVDSDVGMSLAQCCAPEAAVRWHSGRS